MVAWHKKTTTTNYIMKYKLMAIMAV